MLIIILTILTYCKAQTFGNNPALENNESFEQELCPIVVLPPTSGVHTGTVIFFHGSGWSGRMLEKTYVADVMGRKFNFPHLKVLFPTSRVQPYSAKSGQMRNVWFDRYSVNMSFPENYQSIEKMRDPVMRLIQKENEAGIPDNRIVVGGISMGGAMAFYTGFGWKHSLAGVFVLSSFLNTNSFVYKVLESSSDPRPQLFQYHGIKDPLVPITTGMAVFRNLTRLNIKGVLDVYPDGVHIPTKDQLMDAYNWVQGVLPPL